MSLPLQHQLYDFIPCFTLSYINKGVCTQDGPRSSQAQHPPLLLSGLFVPFLHQPYIGIDSRSTCRTWLASAVFVDHSGELGSAGGVTCVRRFFRVTIGGGSRTWRCWLGAFGAYEMPAGAVVGFLVPGYLFWRLVLLLADAALPASHLVIVYGFGWGCWFGLGWVGLV